jgi:hypothetical protein
LLQAFLSILCEPDWINAVSPEICQYYGENPYAFEAQSRILTQRFAQATKPMDRSYSEAYFVVLQLLRIQHADSVIDHMTEATKEQTQKFDDDETYMPLFIFAILWFLFCFALHFLFVEPSISSPLSNS